MKPGKRHLLNQTEEIAGGTSDTEKEAKKAATKIIG
jgi:hypothetical protein